MFVVAVLLEGGLQRIADLRGLPSGKFPKSLAIAGFGQFIAADLDQAVQVFRRVVRTQVSAVAPEGAVLHEAVFEEDLLTALDVLAREDHLSGIIHHPGRDRWRTVVRLDRHQGQQREAEDHH